MIKGWSSLCSRSSRLASSDKIRYLGTSSLSKAEDKRRKNSLFNDEKRRQRAAIGRVEKIEVKYSTFNEDITLSMNKNISTPYDCARHVSEGMAKLSALALVNGEPWDMHRPLEEACDLKLATMRTPGEKSVNNAFWRSCSLLLGAVVEDAFKDEVQVHLHSFTGPNIRSGSFIYDAQLALEDWLPTAAETRSISALFVKLTRLALPFERLETSVGVALDMFKGNPHKSKQIPDIAGNNDNKVILYRVGDHIDISKGPIIGNTGIIGRCSIAAVHKIYLEESSEHLYRFQGVAIPTGILLNHFTYGILEDRAKKLNQTAWMPQRISEEGEENLAMAAKN